MRERQQLANNKLISDVVYPCDCVTSAPRVAEAGGCDGPLVLLVGRPLAAAAAKGPAIKSSQCYLGVATSC